MYCHAGRAGRAHSGFDPGGTTIGAGAAGGAGRGYNGGDGGGGYSAIRIGSTSGTLKAVAGGAGGASGDGGLGGMGGGPIGQHGFPGRRRPPLRRRPVMRPVAPPVQGGNGGSVAVPVRCSTARTPPTRWGRRRGWRFAAVRVVRAWRRRRWRRLSRGGGGQASAVGYAPGGGGGGGSSFTGGLTGAASTQGTGGVGTGSVSITWVTPPPANAPPNVPTDLKINGVAEADGMLTKDTGTVKVTATISDPNKKKMFGCWCGGRRRRRSQPRTSQVFSGWVA